MFATQFISRNADFAWRGTNRGERPDKVIWSRSLSMLPTLNCNLNQRPNDKEFGGHCIIKHKSVRGSEGGGGGEFGKLSFASVRKFLRVTGDPKSS